MPPKPKMADKDRPWVENYPPLHEWLKKQKAQRDWHLPYGDPERPAAMIEQWNFPNGNTATVIVHARQLGWDIRTSCKTDNIEGTLIDAEARLDLDEGGGRES
jgi:hypothetical protein